MTENPYAGVSAYSSNPAWFSAQGMRVLAGSRAGCRLLSDKQVIVARLERLRRAASSISPVARAPPSDHKVHGPGRQCWHCGAAAGQAPAVKTCL
jgi:hypothetical protein